MPVHVKPILLFGNIPPFCHIGFMILYGTESCNDKIVVYYCKLIVERGRTYYRNSITLFKHNLLFIFIEIFGKCCIEGKQKFFIGLAYLTVIKRLHYSRERSGCLRNLVANYTGLCLETRIRPGWENLKRFEHWQKVLLIRPFVTEHSTSLLASFNAYKYHIWYFYKYSVGRNAV